MSAQLASSGHDGASIPGRRRSAGGAAHPAVRRPGWRLVPDAAAGSRAARLQNVPAIPVTPAWLSIVAYDTAEECEGSRARVIALGEREERAREARVRPSVLAQALRWTELSQAERDRLKADPALDAYVRTFLTLWRARASRCIASDDPRLSPLAAERRQHEEQDQRQRERLQRDIDRFNAEERLKFLNSCGKEGGRWNEAAWAAGRVLDSCIPLDDPRLRSALGSPQPGRGS